MSKRISRLTRVAVLSAVAVLGAGCAASNSRSAAPETIVLDLAGQVVVTAPGQAPHVVTGTAQPDNATDDLALGHVRQLSPRLAVGINEAKGELAWTDPSHPGTPKAVPGAFAIDWFPAAQGDDLWVLRIDAGGGCPTVEGGTVALPRYQLGRVTKEGTITSQYRRLPCGDVPIADSAHGTVLRQLTTHTDTGRPDGRIIANLSLLDASNHEKILVADTDPIDSAHNIAVIADRQCSAHSTGCWHAVDLGTGKAKDLPQLPEDRNPAGTGILDSTGRYMALAGVASTAGDVQLVVVDLEANTAHDVADYSSYTALSPGNLSHDMPLVWSDARLYVFNPASSTLTTYDAQTQQSRTLTGLTSTGNAGVWGAA